MLLVLAVLNSLSMVPSRPWPRTGVEAAQHGALLFAAPAAATLLLPTEQAYLAASQADPGGASTLVLLLALALGKRVSLYAMAASAVSLTALRSGDAAAGLGERLDTVTRQALLPFNGSSVMAQPEAASITRSLDATTPSQQAVALPLALGALLVSAYAVALPDAPPGEASARAVFDAASDTLAPVSIALVSASNALTCWFACNAEAQAAAAALFHRAPSAGRRAPQVAAALAAAALVAGAYLLPLDGVGWPLRNAVNMCLAITVGRVLQLPQLGPVALALLGLALYDGVGTTFGGAAVASDLPSAVAGQGLGAMETVARSKLGAAFSPGLLVIALHGRVSDGLGLGDVVFPSMLAGWAHRFDVNFAAAQARATEATARLPNYLTAALVGYGLGCAALEIGPPEYTRAALLWLVPSMLLAVGGRAGLAGELRDALVANRADTS